MRPVEAALIQEKTGTDRRTDGHEKVIGAFRERANVPKNAGGAEEVNQEGGKC
jgi:hypothetical protein